MSLRSVISTACHPITKAYYSLSPGTRILMYHRVNDFDRYDQLTVSSKRFESQLAWLASHKKIVPLDQVAQAAQVKNQVVITFDDGYLDNLEKALPILERYEAPATIYITTKFADQSVSHKRYEDERGRLHLNWQEIKTLSQHPLITIGSHTVSHPFLQRISPEQLVIEIKESKDQIEQQLSMPCDHFCYPAGDYSGREWLEVKKSGYKTATTVSPGQNKSSTNLFALKRTEITDKDDELQMRHKLHGAYDPIHTLLDIKRKQNFAKLAY